MGLLLCEKNENVNDISVCYLRNPEAKISCHAYFA